MPSINAADLTFANLNSDKWGSFVEPQNLNDFIDSDLGQAQINSIQDHVRDIAGYELSEDQIKRMLFSEQAHQDEGYRTPDISDKEMLDEYGGGFFADIGQAFSAAVNGAGALVGLGVETGVDMAAKGVENNSGGLGQAAQDLKSREQTIEDNISGGPPIP